MPKNGDILNHDISQKVILKEELKIDNALEGMSNEQMMQKLYERLQETCEDNITEVRRLTHKNKIREDPGLDDSNDLCELKGYLEKKSPNLFGGWQNRYVVLAKKRLCYFAKEGDEQAKGIINFELIPTTI